MLRLIKAAFNPKSYHYSLVEYLNKELKQNNIKCRKKISYIDINMDTLIDNVYDKIVVDCFNGNIYLRGNGVDDKRLLKIRRFGGYRDSDALYCAKGACNQIIRLLNKLYNNNNLEKTAEHQHIDMRNKLKVKKVCEASLKNSYMDLRGKLRIKQAKKIEAFSRDHAIAIIDGTIYEGDTHGECVTKYLKELGIEDIEFYDRIDLRENLGYNFYTQFAAAHVSGDKIYLDNYSLENISTEQCIQILKSSYPNSEILDYDTMKKLAIYLDKKNRDSAILYINGEIFEGEEHWGMMKQYAANNGIKVEDYESEWKYDSAVEKFFDSSSYATGNKLNNEIYFETDFLFNCTEQEIEAAVNKTYPEYNVIFHEYDSEANSEYMKENFNEELYQQMLNMEYEGSNRMKRLKKMSNMIKKANTEIEDYLENKGWIEKYIGLWENIEYPNISYIDTNTEYTMLNGDIDLPINTIDGVLKISDSEYGISTFDALKEVLNMI